MHVCLYLIQLSSSSSSGLTNSCANTSGEMVERGQKELLEEEERWEMGSLIVLVDCSLTDLVYILVTFVLQVLCFLKTARDRSLVKNLSLFVLFIALKISWLNLKMWTLPTERPADKSIDPTSAQSLCILGDLSHYFQMHRTDLLKGGEVWCGEQHQEEVEQGCCGAAPVPIQRCRCCCVQTSAAAIITQQSCQPLMNLRLGYCMDLCLLLVLSQALCDVFCSPHLLQVLPFPQQRWASGKSRDERRKAGEISTCCNSLWKWAKR